MRNDNAGWLNTSQVNRRDGVLAPHRAARAIIPQTTNPGRRSTTTGPRPPASYGAAPARGFSRGCDHPPGTVALTGSTPKPATTGKTPPRVSRVNPPHTHRNHAP